MIDSDPLAGKMLAEILEGAGHRVSVAADATLAAAGGVDLVVAEPGLLPHGGSVPVLALTKPVRLGTLLARVEEVLTAAQDAASCRLGPWRFDIAARMLRAADGRKVRLTDKEAAILEHLHRAGRVVGREELLAEVWGYSAAVTTHTLETHIYRLRRKIEDDPANATVLLTENGGYRLAD